MSWELTLNSLKPNYPYRCRTAPLTSKRCILYIYSTNIGNEHFKHGIYSPFFPLQNDVLGNQLVYIKRTSAQSIYSTERLHVSTRGYSSSGPYKFAARCSVHFGIP